MPQNSLPKISECNLDPDHNWKQTTLTTNLVDMVHTIWYIQPSPLTTCTRSDTPAVEFALTLFTSYCILFFAFYVAESQKLLTIRINNYRYIPKSQLPLLPIHQHTSHHHRTFDEAFSIAILKMINLYSPATVRKRWE